MANAARPAIGGKKTKKAAKKKRASLKNQLRSNERALKKVTDPGAKATLQAAREKLLRQMKTVKKVKLEGKYARKYGKVRFFERKRIMKARRKLQAEIEAQGWANAEQRAQLKQLDEDAEYVQHFPKDEKYVSLFVTDGDQVHAAAERLRLRALIKTQRAEEALLAEKDEGGFTAADLPPGPEDADGADLGDDEFFAAPEAAGDEEGAGDDDELFTQGAHAHTPKAAPQQARGEQRLATPGKRPGADAGMHNRDRGSAGGDGGKKRRREGQQRGYRDDGDGSGKRQRQLPQARAPDARGHEVGSHAPAAFLGGGAHANGGGHAQHAPSPGRFMHAGATFKPPQKAAKPKKKEKQPVRSRAEGGRKRAKKGKKGKGA